MRRLLTSLAFLSAVALTAGPAEAVPRGVGLGLGLGAALPHDGHGFDPALSWGFYVDIPLISTFHITPSTLVYTLKRPGQDGISATDVSLNFKFMVPLGPLELFAGLTAGLTSTQDLDPHVGGLAGAQFRVLPNVDVFAQANYRVILIGDRNIRDLMIYAGPIFRFY